MERLKRPTNYDNYGRIDQADPATDQIHQEHAKNHESDGACRGLENEEERSDDACFARVFVNVTRDRG